MYMFLYSYLTLLIDKLVVLTTLYLTWIKSKFVKQIILYLQFIIIIKCGVVVDFYSIELTN